MNRFLIAKQLIIWIWKCSTKNCQKMEQLFLRPPTVPWVLMSSVALSPKRLKSSEPAWSPGPAGYSISRRMNGFVLSGLWTAFPQSQVKTYSIICLNYFWEGQFLLCIKDPNFSLTNFIIQISEFSELPKNKFSPLVQQWHSESLRQKRFYLELDL